MLFRRRTETTSQQQFPRNIEMIRFSGIRRNVEDEDARSDD